MLNVGGQTETFLGKRVHICFEGVEQAMYVWLNGEFVGYTSNKTKLQKRINDFVENKEEANIAFIDIKDLPQYSLCLLKKKRRKSRKSSLL